MSRLVVWSVSEDNYIRRRVLLIITTALDGRDIQSLNLRWLRRQIALVDQNPILFNATIFDNIKYGCSEILYQLSENEIAQKVVAAAKEAFAHDFITSLPDGYDTQVGEKGLQLSGGQRQRIAIARALMKDPKILLLDEATSALDSKSEAAVQVALDAASQQRTTIIVAHRLSTIKNADNIIVLADGRVVEEGNHEQLISQDGVYAALVEKQQVEDTNVTSGGDSDQCSVDEVKQQNAVLETRNDLGEKTTAVADSGHGSTPREAKVSSRRKHGSPRPSAKQTLAFIARMSRRDWKLFLFGLVCAIVGGLGIPA